MITEQLHRVAELQGEEDRPAAQLVQVVIVVGAAAVPSSYIRPILMQVQDLTVPL